MYRIQCRLVSYDPLTDEITHPGLWQDYTKKYKSLSALFDAWKCWKARKWESKWSQNGVVTDVVKWEWRPIHCE